MATAVHKTKIFVDPNYLKKGGSTLTAPFATSLGSTASNVDLSDINNSITSINADITIINNTNLVQDGSIVGLRIANLIQDLSIIRIDEANALQDVSISLLNNWNVVQDLSIGRIDVSVHQLFSLDASLFGQKQFMEQIISNYGMRSSDFSPGFGGAGINIENDGGLYNLTLDNLTVRKGLTVFDLYAQRISFIGGMMVSSPGGGLTAKSNLIWDASAELYYFESDADTIAFAAGDIIISQQFTGSNVHYRAFTVSDVSLNRIYIKYDWLNGVFYDFTTESWGTFQCTFTQADSIGTFAATGTDPYIQRTVPTFDGSLNRFFNIRYKFNDATQYPDQTVMFYGVFGGHSYDGGYYQRFALNDDLQWHTTTVDMSTLTVGGTDWIDHEIRQIRLDVENNPAFPGDVVLLDYIWINDGNLDLGINGFEFVQMGNTYNIDRQNLNIIASYGTPNPIIRTLTGVNSLVLGTDKVRAAMGNISDLTNDASLTHGLFADAGLIGNWKISSTALYKDGSTAATSAGFSPEDYPLYAGATYANRANAKFQVTLAGTAYLQSGSGDNIEITPTKIEMDSSDNTGLLIQDSTIDVRSGSNYYPFVSPFGSGIDGDVSIASGSVFLERDMEYDNLHIVGSARLYSAGYTVKVRRKLTIGATAMITNKGYDGVNGSSTGAGGLPPYTHRLHSAKPTGAGGAGGTYVTASSTANAGQVGGVVTEAGSANVPYNFLTGGGGGGGGSHGSGGAGASSGATVMWGFAGGAGGNAVGTGTLGFRGGGGGSGAGPLFLWAHTIDNANATNGINAEGGKGGNGITQITTSSGNGGGGGGSVVVLNYHTTTGSGLGGVTANGGAAGTGGNGGAAGANGVVAVFQI